MSQFISYLRALTDAGLQPFAYAASSDRERVRAEAEPLSQRSPVLDLHSTFADVVSDYQLTLIADQRPKTSIQAVTKGFFSIIFLVKRFTSRDSFEINGINRVLATPSGAQVFKKHELGCDVTEFRGSFDIDLANFIEPAIYAFEGFISKIIGLIAALPLEIGDEPFAKSKVFLAITGIIVIEPRKKASKRSLARPPPRTDTFGDTGFHY